MFVLVLLACAPSDVDTAASVSGFYLMDGHCPEDATSTPLTTVLSPADIVQVWLSSTSTSGVWFTPERGLQLHDQGGSYALIVPECADRFRLTLTME